MTPFPSTKPLLQRSTAARRIRSASPEELKRLLERGEDVESDFTLVSAPIAPRNQTFFVSVIDGQHLLFFIRLLECKRSIAPWQGDAQPLYQGHIEVLLSPRADGIGFSQFILQPDGNLKHHEFAPYPEAASSRWKSPRPVEWGFECQSEAHERGHLIHWAWMRFECADLFAHQGLIGFNICRYDKAHEEFSAWNFLAGNGSPDAQSLGFLASSNTRLPLPSSAPCFGPAEKFRLAITNDLPDTLVANPYTPSAIGAEMRALRKWGMHRVHWISYDRRPTLSAWPLWSKHFAETALTCPDLIKAGADAAHANGLEFIADFKLFDLCIPGHECPPDLPGALPHWDGRYYDGIPELEGRDEAFMQRHPDWQRALNYPIRVIRLYSSDPIEAHARESLRLFTSKDNRYYDPLATETLCITVRKVERNHLRWTPWGTESEPGVFPQWMLEVAGLELQDPFLKIAWEGAAVRFRNPPFLFFEALDASLSSAPFEISLTRAENRDAFLFVPEWQGWVPHHDWALSHKQWRSPVVSIAFRDQSVLPGILEPLHPLTQEIWRERIRDLFAKGIDGISLRLLCHHNNASSWARYAFAPVVIDTFRRAHGRPPEWTPQDIQAIRLLRGEAITSLFRDVRRMAGSRKVIFQVESGAEFPAAIGNWMQIHPDIATWLTEGLVDELHLRAMTAHSPWVRNHLLPLARQYGVELHLISRNLQNGLEQQAVPAFERLIRDAIDLGFHGFNFYESIGLYDLNRENSVVARGLADPVLTLAGRLAEGVNGILQQPAS